MRRGSISGYNQLGSQRIPGRSLTRMAVWLGLLANGLLFSGAWWLAAYGFGQARVLDCVLASTTLAFTWCLLGLELLGSAGWLTIEPLAIWMGLLFVAGLAARWRWRALGPAAAGIATCGRAAEPEKLRCETLIAIALVLWVAAELAMQSLLLPVKVVSDGPIYHLYFAVQWWKAGRLFLVPAPFGESAATYFPANGDLWFTWLMAAWGGDRLARVGQAPFLLLAAMAVHRIARALARAATRRSWRRAVSSRRHRS